MFHSADEYGPRDARARLGARYRCQERAAAEAAAGAAAEVRLPSVRTATTSHITCFCRLHAEGRASTRAKADEKARGSH